VEGKRGVGGMYRRREKREWEAGFPRWWGVEAMGKLCNIAQYFTIKKGTNKNRPETVIKGY